MTGSGSSPNVMVTAAGPRFKTAPDDILDNAGLTLFLVCFDEDKGAVFKFRTHRLQSVNDAFSFGLGQNAGLRQRRSPGIERGVAGHREAGFVRNIRCTEAGRDGAHVFSSWAAQVRRP